ncbi:AAA family ATPase [bacterium]|nr:AAA family ATPase [bacterium]
MAALNIAIGEDIFRILREERRYYVDKTGLIEELLSGNQPKVSLITRPRRFGKTLTMTMLQAFFDIRRDSRALFEGLAVSRNAGLCEKWMNRYPTIFITLKGVEGLSFDYACAGMSSLLQGLLVEHAYLLDSERVALADRKRLAVIDSGQGSEKDTAEALQVICRALEAHFGQPVILLIDEYDVPINYAEQNGYYKEMIIFMRKMLGSALKTNTSLKFAVLTGCLRIAKESIFTGLNNFKCHGISDAQFSDKIGFTEKEVDGLLAEAELSGKKALLKEWYDGYRFGSCSEIYCPWDVLLYIDDLQHDASVKPKAYWNNTSGNAIVRTLISRAGYETREKIGRLIEGKAIEEELAEELTYDIVYKNERNLWSMMYLTGYLTKAPQQPDNGSTALVIPNKEVRQIFTDTVSQWFEDGLDRESLSPFVQALWRGEAETVHDTLNDVLYGTICYFDSAENYYHGFMTGLLRGVGLYVKSNRESGLGRSDIVVEDGRNKRAIIIELKLAPAYDQLEAKAEEGLRQIEERRYEAGLEPYIRRVVKYGVAFWRKECFVKASESAR